MASHFACLLQRRTKKKLLKAAIAVLLLAAGMSCSRTVKPDREVEPNREVKSYTIQNDVLGESPADFQKNQKCVLKPDESGVEGAQTCAAGFSTHYAGMDFVGKLGHFYQGQLYSVNISASTKQCREADLLSLLKERYGEPKLTETIDGHEVTPYVSEGSPPFKIWQNGKQTIAFSESMGSLDLCSVSFTVDAVDRKVTRLQEEKERKEKEAKKKDM